MTITRRNKNESITANGELLRISQGSVEVFPKLLKLKIIKIKYDGRIVEAVLDTDAQICVF